MLCRHSAEEASDFDGADKLIAAYEKEIADDDEEEPEQGPDMEVSDEDEGEDEDADVGGKPWENIKLPWSGGNGTGKGTFSLERGKYFKQKARLLNILKRQAGPGGPLEEHVDLFIGFEYHEKGEGGYSTKGFGATAAADDFDDKAEEIYKAVWNVKINTAPFGDTISFFHAKPASTPHGTVKGQKPAVKKQMSRVSGAAEPFSDGLDPHFSYGILEKMGGGGSEYTPRITTEPVTMSGGGPEYASTTVPLLKQYQAETARPTGSEERLAWSESESKCPVAATLTVRAAQDRELSTPGAKPKKRKTFGAAARVDHDQEVTLLRRKDATAKTTAATIANIEVQNAIVEKELGVRPHLFLPSTIRIGCSSSALPCCRSSRFTWARRTRR